VLHVALDQTVGHVRAFYDTVFDALASSTHLEDADGTHTEIDTHRRIRSYKASDFGAGKLTDAVKIESEAGARPTLIVIDGLEKAKVDDGELADIRALAQELAAEVWFSIQSDSEQVDGLPASFKGGAESISVILALEPQGDEVTLRTLKDHENEDLQNLHVGLDPRTLLLIRS
jgi:hypothetical protein